MKNEIAEKARRACQIEADYFRDRLDREWDELEPHVQWKQTVAFRQYARWSSPKYVKRCVRRALRRAKKGKL